MIWVTTFPADFHWSAIVVVVAVVASPTVVPRLITGVSEIITTPSAADSIDGARVYMIL